MRRLLNFCLLLVLLGAVGFLLFRAKVLPWPDAKANPVASPTQAPVVVRDTLRISVAERPEVLLVSALKRFLEAENLKIELVPFDAETTWMELAAGEIDLVVAPMGEAVAAQARFQAGHFLFVSGLSQGYDLILGKSGLDGAPKNIGVSGGAGHQLLALKNYPESHLLNADNTADLQNWLQEGAIQAALLESANLAPDLTRKTQRLSATSAETPLPTVVVLSRTLMQENETTAVRLKILLAALDSWTRLVGYFTSQPELLRKTLGPEAQEFGVDLDTVLKDYRFLPPDVGRETLQQNLDNGNLNESMDLLVLAQLRNVSTPDWNQVLSLPPSLEAALAAKGTNSNPASLSPTPAVAATPADVFPSTPDAADHHYSGSAPPDPWPAPLAAIAVAGPSPFAPVVLGDAILGIPGNDGFHFYSPDGSLILSKSDAGPLQAAPLADDSRFYLFYQSKLIALDAAGQEIWTLDFVGTCSKTAVLAEGRIIFTTSEAKSHQMKAVNAEDGTLIWEVALTAAPASPPVFSMGTQPTVLSLDENATLHAWNARTGSVLWQSAVGKPSFLPVAAFADAIVISEPNGAVRLVSVEDGSKLWSAELGTPLAGSPTMTQDEVLVPAKDTYLYGLSRKNGSISWKTRLSVPLSEPPVVVADHVYQTDEAGGVHSLSVPGGTLNWSKSFGTAELQPPVFSASFWVLAGTEGQVSVFQR